MTQKIKQPWSYNLASPLGPFQADLIENPYTFIYFPQSISIISGVHSEP